MKDKAPGRAEYEMGRGRIPLWLPPDMIAFILSEWRRLADDTPDAILKQWNELAFLRHPPFITRKSLRLKQPTDKDISGLYAFRAFFARSSRRSASDRLRSS